MAARIGMQTQFSLMLEPGDAITAWSLSAIEEQPFSGVAALAEDRVNYRFINGFVDVGDLPCRKALWQEVADREVALKRDWPVQSVNLPGFNRRLEFSDFWHEPTRLSRWCKTRLIPPTSGDCLFSLATCGGVHIWVDGKLAAKFEPFSRNHEQRTEITLPLKKGGSEIVMLSEDLAERDTNWYVELVLKGTQAISNAIESDARPEDIAQLMAIARDIRPEREFTSGETLSLKLDAAALADVEIEAKILPSVHMRDQSAVFSAKARLATGETLVVFDGLASVPDGYHALDLTLSIGEARVERQIAFALLRSLEPERLARSLQARKAQALSYAADHGEKRIGRALATLATGAGCTPVVEDLIFQTLIAIDARRDCSDFVMVPLLWLYGAYGDQLPQPLAEQVRASVLAYRYWVDEPGNDVMWFWSENHALCFHVSQYLAGRLLAEETFSCSGRSGTEQARLGAERLGKWFDAVEAHGFAEWNSAAYYPIDFIGLLALEHWGEGEISCRAKGLLDRLFRMIALHTLAGVPAGSMGRAYDKELRAGPCTELAPFTSVAFGEGWLNDGVAALPQFCAGAYEPPADLASLVDPEEGTALIAYYVQGYNDAAKLALFKTAHVQLSAAVDGQAGAKGHQQHLLDVRLAAHPFARAWINHPGEDDPWGHQRPSYWAGNGSTPRVGQYGNVGMMLFDIPADHRIDFTHVYAPLDAFDAFALHDDWLILISGKGYAALTACQPLMPVTSGPGERREFRATGSKAGWVVIAGDLSDGAGLGEIKAALSDISVCFDKEAMTLSVARPNQPHLMLSYCDGLSVDGVARPFPNLTQDPQIESIAAPTISPIADF